MKPSNITAVFFQSTIISLVSLLVLPSIYAETKAQETGAGSGLLKADLNKDMLISFSEFAAIKRLESLGGEQKRKLYDFLDKNGDGVLQGSELKPKRPRWISDLKENFQQLDEDNSSDISLEEFSKISAFVERQARGAKHFFGKLDEDKNGAITVEEVNKHLSRDFTPRVDFSKYDIDESGGLDKSEYLKLPLINRIPQDRVDQLFERIDKNKDEELSAEEFKQHHELRRGGGRLLDDH